MKHLAKYAVFAVLLLTVGGLVLLPNTAIHAQQPSNAASWSGFFYNSRDLTGNPVFAVFPSGLNVNWGVFPPTDGTGNPIQGIQADNFSARLSTSVTLPAGFYQFIVTADDGVRLILGGQQEVTLINDLNNYQPTGLRQRVSDVVNLSGGSYNLTVDYFEATENAVLQVSWVTATGGTPLATGTPVPAATGTVVRVAGLSVRTGPFLGASRVAVARPLTDYPILAQNRQEGLFTWYLIQFDEDTQGWVSGRYFDIEGNIAAVDTINPPEFTTVYDPPGTVTAVTRSVMNFRTLPSERTPRVAAVPQLEWGARVEVLARTVQGGRNHWYLVRYSPPDSTASYVGWIFAPFVGIERSSDPIETVPIL